MVLQSAHTHTLFHTQIRLAEAIRSARARRLLDLARELLTALGPAALEPAALHLSIHLLLWSVRPLASIPSAHPSILRFTPTHTLSSARRALERHPEALALAALTLLRDAILDPVLAPDAAGSSSSGGGSLVRTTVLHGKSVDAGHWRPRLAT